MNLHTIQNQGAGRVAQSRVEQNIPEIDIDDEIPF